MTLTALTLAHMIALRRDYPRFFSEWFCPLVLKPVLSTKIRIDRLEWDGESIIIDTDQTTFMIHIDVEDEDGIWLEDDKFTQFLQHAPIDQIPFIEGPILTDDELRQLGNAVASWLTLYETHEFKFLERRRFPPELLQRGSR